MVEPLQETYSRNGTNYKKIAVGQKAAMYQQFMPNGTPIGIEVFVLRVQPEFRFPNGTINPSKIAFPSSESGGSWMWSYSTLASAQKRYDEIENGILKPVYDEEKEEKVKKPKGTGKRGRPRKSPGIAMKIVTVKKIRVPFVWEGIEYKSKSIVAKLLFDKGENKKTIANKLGITVQSVHSAVTKK